MWLIDKQFEFTAHHDLETCKALLLETGRHEDSKAWIQVPIYVKVWDDGEGAIFRIKRGGHRNSTALGDWARCVGTLQARSGAKVIVSGKARMPLLLVAMLGLALVGQIAVIVVGYPNTELIVSLGTLFLVFAVGMFFWSVRERRQLVNMIVVTLTDQEKVKKKSNVVD